jgi:hypothetical protein
MKTILVILLMINSTQSAAQYYGAYGSGTMIREEVNPTQMLTPNYDLKNYESYSITEDTTTEMGFSSRETTYYDCRNDMFGKKVCEERMW